MPQTAQSATGEMFGLPKSSVGPRWSFRFLIYLERHGFGGSAIRHLTSALMKVFIIRKWFFQSISMSKIQKTKGKGNEMNKPKWNDPDFDWSNRYRVVKYWPRYHVYVGGDTYSTMSTLSKRVAADVCVMLTRAFNDGMFVGESRSAYNVVSHPSFESWLAEENVPIPTSVIEYAETAFIAGRSSALVDAIAAARFVFEDSKSATRCLDYLQAYIDNPPKKTSL
jgi:hypothetical protein